MDKKQENKKVFKIILLTIIVSVFIVGSFLLYEYVIFPFIAYYRPMDSYCGKELFAEKDFLQYEAGVQLDEALQELDFMSDAEILHFAYFDGSPKDGFLTGKYPDFYIIDVDLGDAYDRASDAYSSTYMECVNEQQYGKAYGYLYVKLYPETHSARIMLEYRYSELQSHSSLADIFFYSDCQTEGHWGQG